MASENRPFAVITGASFGIGLGLAKCCARNVLIDADEAAINTAAAGLRDFGVTVEAVEADRSTAQGVDN